MNPTIPELPICVLLENKQVYGNSKLVMYTKAPYFVCQVVKFPDQASENDFYKTQDALTGTRLQDVRIHLLLTGAVGEVVVGSDASATAQYVSKCIREMADWYSQYLQATDPDTIDKYRY